MGGLLPILVIRQISPPPHLLPHTETLHVRISVVTLLFIASVSIFFRFVSFFRDPLLQLFIVFSNQLIYVVAYDKHYILSQVLCTLALQEDFVNVLFLDGHLESFVLLV